MRRGLAGGAAVILALVAGATLTAGVPSAKGPVCPGANLRLLPLYADGTPGAISPATATTDLLATGTAPALAGLALTARAVEARGSTAMVEVRTDGHVVGVARTANHPMGGWLVDEFWTCAEFQP